MAPLNQPAWLEPARKIISEFEGCSLKSYPDPGTGGDPWTIGYGHTGSDVGPDSVISQSKADGLLIIDMKEAANAVFEYLPMAADWKPNEQAALISFTYNVGANALKTSLLRQRLLAGEPADGVVAMELPRWNKANGKEVPGLTKRRLAEVALFAFEKPYQQPAKVEPKPPSGPPVWPANMVGPKKRPDINPGDHHLIANDISETLTAYASNGVMLWRIPCLCRGQGGEAEWKRTGEDTPPGLYKLGKVYRDYEDDPSSDNFSADRRAYGWYSIDMIGLEGQEGPDSRPYRDGIMMHGGGSACGWPGAWAARQPLYPTLGCVRLHNQDLRDRVLPLLSLGTVWVSVLQEKP